MNIVHFVSRIIIFPPVRPLFTICSYPQIHRWKKMCLHTKTALTILKTIFLWKAYFGIINFQVGHQISSLFPSWDISYRIFIALSDMEISVYHVTFLQSYIAIFNKLWLNSLICSGRVTSNIELLYVVTKLQRYIFLELLPHLYMKPQNTNFVLSSGKLILISYLRYKLNIKT